MEYKTKAEKFLFEHKYEEAITHFEDSLLHDDLKFKDRKDVYEQLINLFAKKKDSQALTTIEKEYGDELIKHHEYNSAEDIFLKILSTNPSTRNNIKTLKLEISKQKCRGICPIFIFVILDLNLFRI